MRAAGVLLPIASLPSTYGIGAFSKNAYQFIDILQEAGQRFWQILPMGPTGYGDSPYQSFSTFAGNPYFIDLEPLLEQGLLLREEVEQGTQGLDEKNIDYAAIYRTRDVILKQAFSRARLAEDESYQRFVQENNFWLEEYALYMAIKNHKEGSSWTKWETPLRMHQAEALQEKHLEYQEEILFVYFEQYLFAKQWKELKKYANERGIQIIGDIPIYVALDSADAWANPQLFQFDEDKQPQAVAGCPPDGFSSTGQLWGNPLYAWEYHKNTEYAWWVKRIQHCFSWYDVVRVDHFRGFDEYYAIPYGNETAEYGKWEKGPGLELFTTLQQTLGELRIIAEDLGYLTDSVRQLVKDTGYPSMKVLQFAYDSREDSDYLPHNYDKNCVVYTGTHDNDTTQGWYQKMAESDRAFAKEYMRNAATKLEDIHWDFIAQALASVADTAIIPMPDYLGLGTDARINTPSTLGNNWVWRLKREDISQELIRKMRRLAKIYGRIQ